MKKNNQPDRIQDIMLGGIFLWLAIWGSKMIAAGNFLVGIILSLVGLTQCYPRLARGLKGLNFKKATSVFSTAEDKNPQGILDKDIMESEINLSEKIELCKCEEHNLYGDFINVEDVREFIKEIREEIKKGDLYRCKNCQSTLDFIDKVSGEKLNGKQ